MGGRTLQTHSHWENVYATKAADAVSWYQEHAEESLHLIRATGVPLTGNIIDVGGGASTLVDDLLQGGYTNLTVLDISAAALEVARARLQEWGHTVTWIAGDVTQVDLPTQAYDLWHDRAVFHFLTDEADRRAYVAQVLRAVKPGGHVIVATFAEDGPTQCSGLPVVRYSPSELHAQFGGGFELVKHDRESHVTPFGKIQNFIYCLCRVEPRAVQTDATWHSGCRSL